VNTFAEWEEKIGLRRTSVLGVTLWMTWRAFDWAAQFANVNGVDGTDSIAIAAIITAVTAPICYLQVAVFKAYLDSKS
jgi:hypothetical protein